MKKNLKYRFQNGGYKEIFTDDLAWSIIKKETEVPKSSEFCDIEIFKKLEIHANNEGGYNLGIGFYNDENLFFKFYRRGELFREFNIGFLISTLKNIYPHFLKIHGYMRCATDLVLRTKQPIYDILIAEKSKETIYNYFNRKTFEYMNFLMPDYEKIIDELDNKYIDILTKYDLYIDDRNIKDKKNIDTTNYLLEEAGDETEIKTFKSEYITIPKFQKNTYLIDKKEKIELQNEKADNDIMLYNNINSVRLNNPDLLENSTKIKNINSKILELISKLELQIYNNHKIFTFDPDYKTEEEITKINMIIEDYEKLISPIIKILSEKNLLFQENFVPLFLKNLKIIPYEFLMIDIITQSYLGLINDDKKLDNYMVNIEKYEETDSNYIKLNFTENVIMSKEDFIKKQLEKSEFKELSEDIKKQFIDTSYSNYIENNNIKFCNVATWHNIKEKIFIFPVDFGSVENYSLLVDERIAKKLKFKKNITQNNINSIIYSILLFFYGTDLLPNDTNFSKTCLNINSTIHEYTIRLTKLNLYKEYNLINRYNLFKFNNYSPLPGVEIGKSFFQNKKNDDNIKDIPSLSKFLFHTISNYKYPNFDIQNNIFTQNGMSINEHEVNTIETNATIINI